MNHHEIEQQEIIERYVRHQLQPAERLAFQEHFFACENCFAQVQDTAKFIAGVQRSARVGTLAETAREIAGAPESSSWRNWFKPLMGLAAATCLLLTCTLGWLLFSRLPKLQTELAQVRQSQTELAREKEQILQNSQAELEKERQQRTAAQSERERLEQELKRQQPAVAVPTTPTAPPRNARPATDDEVNVPVIILEATRNKKAQEPFAVSRQAKALTLWVEVESGSRFDQYQMQIFSAQGGLLKTLSGLKANSYGALAVSVPAQQLPPGKYQVKLFGLKAQQKELVGDYALTLR